MMPEDPLDGIKTFKGKVVYHRKKHDFSISDAARIVKKIDLIQESENIVKEHIFYAAIQSILSIFVRFLGTQSWSTRAFTVLELTGNSIDVALKSNTSTSSNAPGFGGAGASREF